MRDKSLIKKNWQKIAELHEKLPDWRMSQFLVNLFRELENDPFYLEDDAFLKLVYEIVEKLKN